MYTDEESRRTAGGADQDRRDTRQPSSRLLGRVVACSGSRATISAHAQDGDTALAELWSVGRLISIAVGDNRVVALVYSMQSADAVWIEQADNVMRFEVELVGEIRSDGDGRPRFSAGISRYPFLGAIAHRIRSADLAAIYEVGKRETATIGKLTQDETMDAAIHIPSMLERHFAVVGTTGVGKSTAVALLLNKALESKPGLRVLILDPHNEFAAAFPGKALVVDPETLDLPFWLFKLEEFVEVIFRGRPGIDEEVDVLRDLIPEAKRGFRAGPDNALFRRSADKSSLTADTPVPYRVADLLALIDERIGRLEGRAEKPHLRALKVRIMSAINDPRFRFMFSSNTINDTIVETIARLFRIPGNGQPVTTFQLAGIPSEVVNAVASVLCRMAFEVAVWSNGAVQILVVCEEAHRYVPADRELGFVPTRQAIARIAKEGRKYGVSLGVVTQRPGELDPTILSQCSTVFAMRLANDHDQEIIRSAIPDSSTSTTSFLSSIGNGEAIAFGEAVPVPMRMRFERLNTRHLPKTQQHVEHAAGSVETLDLRAVVQRMRSIAPQDVLGAAAGAIAAQPGDEPADAVPATGTVRADRDMRPEPRFRSHAEAARPGGQAPDGHAGRTAPEPPSARDPAEPAGGLSARRQSILKKPISSILKS